MALLEAASVDRRLRAARPGRIRGGLEPDWDSAGYTRPGIRGILGRVLGAIRAGQKMAKTRIANISEKILKQIARHVDGRVYVAWPKI